jgi:hypothetical protein
VVEPGQERRHGGEAERKAKAGACTDPKNVAGQSMVDLFVLNNRLGKTIQPKVGKQQAESGDHGQQAKVRWREQSGEYSRRCNLDGQSQAGRQHCSGRSPDRESSHNTPTDRSAALAFWAERREAYSAASLGIRPAVTLCNHCPALGYEVVSALI